MRRTRRYFGIVELNHESLAELEQRAPVMQANEPPAAANGDEVLVPNGEQAPAAAEQARAPDGVSSRGIDADQPPPEVNVFGFDLDQHLADGAEARFTTLLHSFAPPQGDAAQASANVDVRSGALRPTDLEWAMRRFPVHFPYGCGGPYARVERPTRLSRLKACKRLLRLAPEPGQPSLAEQPLFLHSVFSKELTSQVVNNVYAQVSKNTFGTYKDALAGVTGDDVVEKLRYLDDVRKHLKLGWTVPKRPPAWNQPKDNALIELLKGVDSVQRNLCWTRGKRDSMRVAVESASESAARAAGRAGRITHGGGGRALQLFSLACRLFSSRSISTTRHQPYGSKLLGSTSTW